MTDAEQKLRAELVVWIGLTKDLQARVENLRAALDRRQAAIDAAAKALRDVENVL